MWIPGPKNVNITIDVSFIGRFFNYLRWKMLRRGLKDDEVVLDYKGNLVTSKYLDWKDNYFAEEGEDTKNLQ